MTESETDTPGRIQSVKRYFRLLLDIRSPLHRRFVTFLFFVVISAVFWFFRSLSETYETEVIYPVRYSNFPDNKLLVGHVPDKLRLRVRARGFLILKSRLKINLAPLRFDVNSYSLNSAGPDSFFILTESAKSALSEGLRDAEILDISPDTLFFRFTGIRVKRVAVCPQVEYTERFFQKQYMLSGNVSVKPDSVVISGPGNLVDTIRCIHTQPITGNNLNDTLISDFKLQPALGVTCGINQVEVMIPVDRFTEVEENLAVLSANVPDSLQMIAIPGQVQATYQICISNYKKILENPLRPRIDYLQLNDKSVKRLTVFLADTPHYVKRIRFSPAHTEFLITRK